MPTKTNDDITDIDADQLVRSRGFSCTGAASSSRSVPDDVAADFHDVVVGVLGNGHLMDRVYATWLPELTRGKVYLFADACHHANVSLAMFLRCNGNLLTASSTCARGGRRRPRTEPTVRLNCFDPPHDRVPLSTPFGRAGASWLSLPHLNRTNSLWVKTAAFLRGMWRTFPQQRWYFKADEDTLLFPRALFRFLTAIRPAIDAAPSAALYLGNVATTRQLDLSPGVAAAGLRPAAHAWRELQLPAGGEVGGGGGAAGTRGGETVAEAAENAAGVPNAVRYANGGAGYLLSTQSMRLLAGGGSGSESGTASDDPNDGLLEGVRLYFGNYSLFAHSRMRHQPAEGVAPLGEDAAVGLRLMLGGVAPLHCECFYQGPPCADGVVSLDPRVCTRLDTRWYARGSLCEWPLSVHWIKSHELNPWIDAARQRGLLRPGGVVRPYMH